MSTLGLLVNLVGMSAFGHHHHGGHDHGHSHGHDHSHAQGKKHDDHCHDHDTSHSHSSPHGHSHDNENMYGIYLHVLADTLGSAAVIVSTVLTHFWRWSGWDPLASCAIALLILLSALPLVASSARRLLLTIPDDAEYALRETLGGLTALRGVVSYAAPKFWIDDRSGGGSDGHDHDVGAEKKRRDHAHVGDDVRVTGSQGGLRLLGVVHVAAARGADLDAVRERVRSYLAARGIDVAVQVEREGDASCWCGIASSWATSTAVGGGGVGGGGVGAGGAGTSTTALSVAMGGAANL